MPFPMLAFYPWGDLHYLYAPREHEDLETIARILNNLTIITVPGQNYAEIERTGDHWTIKIPGEPAASPTSDEDADNDEASIQIREVDVCVDGQIKKMKVMGTAPY